MVPDGFLCSLQGTGQYEMTDSLALKTSRTLYEILCAVLEPEIDPLGFIISCRIHAKDTFCLSQTYFLMYVITDGAIVNENHRVCVLTAKAQREILWEKGGCFIVDFFHYYQPDIGYWDLRCALCDV